MSPNLKYYVKKIPEQKPGGKTKTVNFLKQASLKNQTSSRSTSLPIETTSIVNDNNLISSDSFASSSSLLISESKVLTDFQHGDSSCSSEEDEAPPNKMVPDVTEDLCELIMLS
ncbi:hypothetical protein DPMN_053955 [Dreissena polymorpha]|uniref:Uncharacterized protein n=1 Tax=Dreissena polymorpha TaxID=45954 RepID=A0A9D4CMC6_DREPO|nr:hypothetical protein DPMN_053955 [Dreissena polymorpha]